MALLETLSLGLSEAFLSESARSGSFSGAVRFGAYLTCGCSCGELWVSLLALGFLSYAKGHGSLGLPRIGQSFPQTICFCSEPWSALKLCISRAQQARVKGLWVATSKAVLDSELVQWSSGSRHLEGQKNIAESQNHMHSKKHLYIVLRASPTYILIAIISNVDMSGWVSFKCTYNIYEFIGIHKYYKYI